MATTVGCIASLAQQTVTALALRHMTLGVAESCSGGLLAAALTAVSGCSEVFPGGVVSYCDEVKRRLLGVRGKTLERESAVSAATAAEMAIGACRRLRVDGALSLTGYAGPGGGTARDGVGTVYIGLALRGRVTVYRYHAPVGADRETVRTGAVACALRRLLAALASLPAEDAAKRE